MNSVTVILPVYKPNLEYLDTMISSILSQLDSKDELILHFDDSCILPLQNIVKNPAIFDIKILPAPGRSLGVNKAFKKLVYFSSNSIVVFADQDDCWVPGRLDVVRRAFADNPNVSVVALKPIICDSKLLPLQKENFLFRLRSMLPCFIYNSVVGNCLAVRRDFFLKYTSHPFDVVGMYDWHIGILASFMRTLRYLDYPGTYWRFHDQSETFPTRYSFRFFEKIRWRAQFIYLCWICILDLVRDFGSKFFGR